VWSSSATLQINPKTKSNVNEGINQGGAGAGAGGEGGCYFSHLLPMWAITFITIHFSIKVLKKAKFKQYLWVQLS